MFAGLIARVVTCGAYFWAYARGTSSCIAVWAS
jgi:hypothetical protein